MRLLLAATFALCALPALANSAIPPTDIIKGAVTGYVRPVFHVFAVDTGTLKTDMTALCAAPSGPAFGKAQDDFRLVATSLARVEFLYFGPLTIDDRNAELLFWPDNKGIALKQVQQALAAEDPTAISPDTLAKKSVAMQGLGALEFVLFGTGSDAIATADGAYRCSYGAAIATLVDGIGQTLDQEWQDDTPDGPLAHMLAPKPDAQDYRTQQEVLEKLAGALIVGTEVIRDQRLSPIIAASEAAPRPKSALFWRSGMTIPMLEAGFTGLDQFFRAARFPEAVRGSDFISNGALFEFDNAISTLKKISDPIDKVVADPAGMQKLNYLVNITRSLDTLLGDNLPGAMGLTVGFSALDGD
jgi:predicted lipoprotein